MAEQVCTSELYSHQGLYLTESVCNTCTEIQRREINTGSKRVVCLSFSLLVLAVFISGVVPPIVPNLYGDHLDANGRFIMDDDIMSKMQKPWLVTVR